MSRRIAGVLVTFQEDMTEQEAARTIDAMRRFIGVAGVEEIPADVTLAMAETRAAHRISDKLIKLALEMLER